MGIATMCDEMSFEIVDFVGLYASFPFGDNPQHWVKLAQMFISLEDELDFRTAQVIYRKSYRQRTMNLEGSGPRKILEQFAVGELRSLYLETGRPEQHWVERSRASVSIEMGAAYFDKPPPGPVHKRFGLAGTLCIIYPYDRFQVGEPSSFQQTLVDTARKSFCELEPSYIFINAGKRTVMPGIVGSDQMFLSTRDSTPFSSFDYDIRCLTVGFYKEFIRGGFWANFLNPTHVARLGGREHILKSHPCSIVEDLGGDRLLLQVGPSPLVTSTQQSAKDYQKLRKFLRPILLETGEDMQKLQYGILGASEYERILREAPKSETLRKIRRRRF